MVCFLCGGRKIIGFSVWIDINLVFVSWYSTANIDGVLRDRFVGYVALLLGKHSVGVDWLAQWLIRHNRKKEVQASNRSQR